MIIKGQSNELRIAFIFFIDQNIDKNVIQSHRNTANNGPTCAGSQFFLMLIYDFRLIPKV